MRAPTKSLISIAILVLILAFCTPVSSQQVDGANATGFPVNGVFQGGAVDSVQLNNGNLHLEIPIWSAKGRGIDVGVKFTYDSRVWQLASTCDEFGNCNSTAGLGWNQNGLLWQRVYGTQGTSAISYDLTTVQCGTATGTGLTNIVLYDQDNTPHNVWPDVLSNCPGYQLTAYSSDGSGWLLKTTQPDYRVYPTIDSTYSKDGTKNGEDSNGNQVPGSIDTLGRTIYTDGSYIDSSGTRRYLQLQWTDVPVHTSLCQWNPNPGSCNEYSNTWHVISKVTLPNGLAYIINYVPNSYGQPASITLPSGGQISYTWTTADTGGPAVASRTVTANGNSGTWTYQYYSNFDPAYITKVTDPSGNDTTFAPAGGGISYAIGQAKYFSGSSTAGTLMKTVSNDYSTTLMGNPLIRVTTTWNQQNLVSKVEADWDQNTIQSGWVTTWGNPIAFREYDWGTGTPGSLVRSTSYSYLHLQNTAYKNANIANRLVTKSIYDSSNVLQAQSTTLYDGSALISTTGVPSHDYTNFGTSNLVRGNATIQERWLKSTNTWLSITNTFDDLGNLRSSTDPLGHVTTYDYSDNFTDGVNRNAMAFATKITLPVTGGVNHTERKQFYWYTSLLAATCGQNFPSASACANSYAPPQSDYETFTYDLANRPLATTHGDGGSISVSYNDVTLPLSTTITTTATPSPNIVRTTIFDGLGRVSETQLNSDPDCAAGDKTDTTYDALGRMHTMSNPYCSASDPTYGLTTYAYDALGRTIQVTHPDNSTVLTTYAGRSTQVQDEGNGTRRVTHISQVDSFGRLASVCEVTSATQLGTGGRPAACGQDIAATGFLTTYGYDTLNNLTSVSQNGLNSRTFQYDSLSRLTSASNPESGTTTYAYDANGNVTLKTDARSIKTCFGDWNGTSCNGSTGYDALNRVMKKTYSDSTPAMYYSYDVPPSWCPTCGTNLMGRLVEAKNQCAGTAGCGTSTLNSYDAMGRTASQWEQTPALAPGGDSLSYTYDLAGTMTSSTNGVGATLNYTPNGATRLTTMTSSLVDSNHPGTLFSSAHYNAAGSLLSGSFGTVITETRAYDSRLRLSSIADGSNYSLTIASSGGYAPNGDILADNDSVNGNWTYSYDDFNRLSGSNQNAGHAVYSYVYDRFGNRWQQNGPHPMQLSFSGANNRMDGYYYDAAGNLLGDGTYCYAYDAEDRIIQVSLTPCPNGSVVASYVYDANGQRVEKTIGSYHFDYLYDLGGHQVTEWCGPCSWGTGNNRNEIYAGSRHVATYANGTTYFIHPDWLGTERARSSVTGTPYETCTSLPFGDWLTCSGGDPSPMHFTGKPHDAESNLDYFGARYMGSNFGRFMSSDPLFADKNRLPDPQQLGLYDYGRDNPLKFTDPTGMTISCESVHCAGYLQKLDPDRSFKVDDDDDGDPTGFLDKRWESEDQFCKALCWHWEPVDPKHPDPKDPKYKGRKRVGDYVGDVYCDSKCYIWLNDVGGARWVPYDRNLMHKIQGEAIEKREYEEKCKQWNAVMDTVGIVGFMWSFGTGGVPAAIGKVEAGAGIANRVAGVCK